MPVVVAVRGGGKSTEVGRRMLDISTPLIVQSTSCNALYGRPSPEQGIYVEHIQNKQC